MAKNPKRTPAKRGPSAEAVASSRMQRSISVHQGPLPPPETLAQYDSVSPGLAERIVEMSEKAQMHNQEVEKEQLALARMQIKSASEANRLGIFIAAFLTIALLVTAITLLFVGQTIPGLVVVIGEFVLLVITIIVQRVLPRRG